MTRVLPPLRISSAASLLLAFALPAQVQVVAGPGPPSDMLEKQLGQGGDEFVLFDVGYAAYHVRTCVEMVWVILEGDRLKALHALLPQLSGVLAGSDDPHARRAAHVADVAAALAGIEVKLDGDETAERDTVVSGRVAPSRFVPETKDVDWRIATPIGAYGNKKMGEDKGQLFRVSVYLRECLLAMPAPMRGQWDAATERCDKDVRDRLAAVDVTWRKLFGDPVTPAMAGVPGRYSWRDVVRIAATTAGSPWLALLEAHSEVDAKPDVSVRDAFVHATHVLATETSTDPLLAAMPMDLWHAKWRDTADWLYLGLREVDVLGEPASAHELTTRPTVLIEPLPASFAALRELDRASLLVLAGCGGEEFAKEREAKWWPDLLAELDAQTRGAAPDPGRQVRLLDVLLQQFDAVDMLAGTESNLDGIAGALRRAGPFLVRVPIRWRGETKHALALRMYVEHAPTPGKWTEPPWGRELHAGAPAPAKAR
jgi:hypothetical protein